MWLDQSALVVPRLWPGIWKINQHFVEIIRDETRRQHFHGVMADDSQIAKIERLRSEEAVSDARFVDLEAEIIALGMAAGHRDQRIAIAKADFQRSWSNSPENIGKVNAAAVELDSVAWPKFSDCACLSNGLPAAASHERANRSRVIRLRHGRRADAVVGSVGLWGSEIHGGVVVAYE